jgi:glycosyltransferase involved in cell wall biosynthesis
MFAVSFVIPCYNAESFIIKNITQLKNKVDSLKINYEILLIDDGKPIVEADPDHEISKIYLDFAKKIRSTYL